MTLVKNFNTKRRKRERETKNGGWSRERDRARNRKSMETSIFVEYLKSTDPAEKRRNTSELVWLVWLLKFFRLPSIFALTPLPPPPFLLHPLLCSPLRDHRASPSTCIDRVHVWCVQPRIFARGWLKCAFWKPILNWILRILVTDQGRVYSVAERRANRRYVCSFFFFFFLFLDFFFSTCFSYRSLLSYILDY